MKSLKKVKNRGMKLRNREYDERLLQWNHIEENEDLESRNEEPDFLDDFDFKK